MNLFEWIKLLVAHFIIRNSIVINVQIANISDSILICVFLTRILMTKNKSQTLSFHLNLTYRNTWTIILSTHRMRTFQVIIGPTIQVSVATAMKSVASEADFALATESPSTDVSTNRVLVADRQTISAKSWNLNAAVCCVRQGETSKTWALVGSVSVDALRILTTLSDSFAALVNILASLPLEWFIIDRHSVISRWAVIASKSRRHICATDSLIARMQSVALVDVNTFHSILAVVSRRTRLAEEERRLIGLYALKWTLARSIFAEVSLNVTNFSIAFIARWTGTTNCSLFCVSTNNSAE